MGGMFITGWYHTGSILMRPLSIYILATLLTVNGEKTSFGRPILVVSVWKRRRRERVVGGDREVFFEIVFTRDFEFSHLLHIIFGIRRSEFEDTAEGSEKRGLIEQCYGSYGSNRKLDKISQHC